MDLLKVACQLVKKMQKEYPQYNTKNCYNEDLKKFADIKDIKLEDEKFFEGKKRVADGYTGIKGDTFYITFFSTNSKKDWVFNFRGIRRVIPYEGTNKKIRVHTGYITAYKACRDEIANRLKASGKKKVVITGHSLGGAVATIAALDIKYNNPESSVDVVSFGSPRVGNKHFVASFNKRLPNNIRVSTGNEFTLVLPPEWTGYRHVGVNKHYGAKTVWWKINTKDHWPSNFINAINKK